MIEQDASRGGAYNLVSARRVERATLIAFSQTIWPDRSPDRLLSSWWMRADDNCSVAAIHRSTGIMAGLCAGRPSKWVVDGQTHPAVAICDWYVASGHAARMLGRRLVRHFEMPDRMLYAFSMSDDAIAYLARLGWVGPYTSALLALPLPHVARWVHAVLPSPRALDLRDYVVASGALPAPLAEHLDRIQTARTGDATAHMRRGADEWSWRLSICGERSYRFCLAYRAGEPVGYIAVRRLSPGSSRLLGKIPGALLTDLAAVGDDSEVLSALVARATVYASKLGAAVVLAATTNAEHRRALARTGFLSPGFPLLGRLLERRAPQYMWLPRGPAAQLAVNGVLLTFADSDVDFKL
jgi:hypothetical protein